jgi:hypothetical protein
MADISMSLPMPSIPINIDGMCRSLPNSPYDIDTRDTRAPLIMSGPFDAQMEDPDYFSKLGMRSFGSRPPLPPRGFEGDMYTMGSRNQ